MTPDSLIDDLLDRWESLREQGQLLSAEELCEGYPELLPNVKKQLAALQWVDARLQPENSFTGTGHASEWRSTWQLGDYVGRYRLERILGRGGFGEVWQAHDPQLDRAVAIKLLHRRKHQRQSDAVQFTDEGRKLAKLRHPNILPVYDAGDHAGQLYMVSELITGATFAESVVAEPKLSIAEIVTIIIKVARAVDYLHHQQLVHRDIKPANILLTVTGEPILTDLGIALPLNEAEGSSEVPAAGTRGYMSPEQAGLIDEEIDRRSDIYSLGVTLYEALAGQRPIIMSNQGNAAVTPPSQFNSAITPALDRVCLNAIAYLPGNRPSNAQVFAAALEAAMVARGNANNRFLMFGWLLAFMLLCGVAVLVFRYRVVEEPVRDVGKHGAASSKAKDSAKSVPASHSSSSATIEAPARIFTGHAKGVESMAIFSDRNRFATGSRDGTLRIWDIESGKQLGSRMVDWQGNISIAVSPDGTHFLCGNRDGYVRYVSLNEQQEPIKLAKHPHMVLSVRFLQNGRLALSTGSQDSSVRLWDIEKQKELKRFPTTAGWCWSVIMSPDENTLVGAVSSHLQCWNFDSTKTIREMGLHGATIYTVVYSPDGKQLLTASADRSCRILDAQTGRELKKFLGHEREVQSAIFLSNGKQIASTSRDGTVRIWNIESKQEVQRFTVPKLFANCILENPNRSEVLVGYSDGLIRAWNVK